MNAIALVDCNNFYVSCERLFQPKLNGRPVVVLSNNDGCVVSRSQEVKDLGIPMGIPLFEIRHEVKKYGIEVYSSNYTLYGDMSSRVHEAIANFSNEIENYSIDEAFAILEANRYSKSLFESGVDIRTSVKRWTGIPTSVGIAPTKTLAKLASKLAKKNEDGVFDLTDPTRIEQVLSKTGLTDIWGINTRTARELEDIGITTALELRDLDARSARKKLTVVGSRIVDELRGKSCLALEMVTPLKKSICCSRTFSGEVKTLTEMTESVIVHLSTAAEKMRKQQLVTNAVSLFIATNRFKEKGLHANSATIKVTPTDSTRELLSYAIGLLHAIYKPGYAYRKSGVILLGLQPRTAETVRLFDEHHYMRDRKLMTALDTLNARYGRQAVRFGIPIKREKTWHMSPNHLSNRFTTNIREIMKV